MVEWQRRHRSELWIEKDIILATDHIKKVQREVEMQAVLGAGATESVLQEASAKSSIMSACRVMELWLRFFGVCKEAWGRYHSSPICGYRVSFSKTRSAAFPTA